MHKYAKIGQFRNAMKCLTDTIQFQGVDSEGKAIMDRNMKMPIVPFVGTVKLHGTNAAICRSIRGAFSYQSRNNVLTRESDNAGFCNAMMDIEDKCGDISKLFEYLPTNCEATIYGEWAGGNIQGGVSIAKLDKAFYVFAIRVDDPDEEMICYIDMNLCPFIKNEEVGIYNIWDDQRFPRFNIDIDMNDPQASTEILTSYTNYVEKQCPVGFHFGVDGVGEGIVWHPAFHSGFYTSPSDNGHMFKVKGEKHSDTKVKKLVSIDPQIMKDINEFVTNTCTEHRLRKGIDFLVEDGTCIDQKATGHFIKWVTSDIMSEEQDTIKESELSVKHLPGAIAKAARVWYFEHIE